MSDNNEPPFPPCHVSPQSAPCRCCSDHRQIIQNLRQQLNAAQALLGQGPYPLSELDLMMLNRHIVQKQEEEKRQIEALTHTILKIAQEEDLTKQIGKDMYLGLVDYDKIRSFPIRNQTPLAALKEEVAGIFHVPVQSQRYWLWKWSKRGSLGRPDHPLMASEEMQTVGTLREVSKKLGNDGLFLFLDVEHGPDLSLLPSSNKYSDHILIFFKLYDAEKEKLRYVGRMFVKKAGKPLEILAKLNELAGFPENEEIDLFEEREFIFRGERKCRPMDKRTSFKDNRLEDGDVIFFQKAIVSQCGINYRYPDVPSFLEYVLNRQVVYFRHLKNPKDDAFSLELSKLHTYDDVVERVADQIKVDDPCKICFTCHDCYLQQPSHMSFLYRDPKHLSDMLRPDRSTKGTNILYYEVLDTPLPELQGLKTLNVIFHHSTKKEVESHHITLPKNCTVGDVVNNLKSKVKLSRPYAELRLLMVCNHTIYKIFLPFEKIEKINDKDFTEHKNDLYRTLRAEEIPEEDANPRPQDWVIHVYHIRNNPNRKQVQNFGDPFLFVLHEGETLAEVKYRIQERLKVHSEEFAKWKFAFVYMSRPEYLKDSDVISSCFQRTNIVYGWWEQYLGLEHTDTTT